MFEIALACFLLNVVPVTDCDPRAQYYVEQARQIPESHLAMITSISLWDVDNGDAGPVSKTIRLPATNHFDTTVLAHETGHIVAATLALNDSYIAAFWRGGVPIGKTTRYGASAQYEDFAECYSAFVRLDMQACDNDRRTWIQDHAFKELVR